MLLYTLSQCFPKYNAPAHFNPFNGSLRQNYNQTWCVNESVKGAAFSSFGGCARLYAYYYDDTYQNSNDTLKERKIQTQMVIRVSNYSDSDYL